MANGRLNPVRPSPLRFGRSDRSPERNPLPDYLDLDPLLSNLSPDSTLEVLSSTNAVPKQEKVAQDILWKSISQVSPVDRALGIRAAVTAQKLSLWYTEVQSWTWPKRTDMHMGKGFTPPSTITSGTEYYGSLPAEVVVQKETRIEEIRDELDNLDVELLKEHVLNAHIPGRSRPSSSNSTMSVPPPLSYVQLSDFTAVITAIILRALPLLSRLNSLLSTWDVRLLVLRQIPGLLRGLQLARSALDSSSAALKISGPPCDKDVLYSLANFHARRADLQAMVASTGRRMDAILDALEDREDSLPENWIDDLETIESDFSTWVVDSERRAIENEWMRRTISDKPTDEPSQLSRESTEKEEPARNRSDTGRQQGRPFKMETISEEPSGAPESVGPASDQGTFDQSIEVADRTAESCTREIELTSSQNESQMESLSPKIQLDTKPEESDTTLDVTEVPQKTFNATVADDIHSPNDQRPSQEIPACVDESPKGSAYVFQENNVSSDSPTESTAPPPDVQPKHVPFLPVSARETETTHALSVAGHEEALKQDETESIRTDTFLNPRPSETARESPIESDSQLDGDDEKAQTSGPTEPADAQPQDTEMPPPLVKVEPCDVLELEGSSGLVSDGPALQRFPTTDDESALLASVKLEATTTEGPAATLSTDHEEPQYASPSSVVEPSKRSISPATAQEPAPQRPSEGDAEPKESPPAKQLLESPIKLSKARPGRLSLENDNKKSRRRPSTASAGSLSDYPSLVSSPEVREPCNASSNGTPLLLDTPPHYQTEYPDSELTPSHNDHTLRADRLLRLESQKASPQTALKHNRNVSLPLQRFINEEMHLEYDGGNDLDVESSSGRRVSAVSTDLPAKPQRRDPLMPLPPRERSSKPTNDSRRVTSQHSGISREKPHAAFSGASTFSGGSIKLPKRREQSKKALPKNSDPPQQPVQTAAHAATARLKKQLTAHPSLEGLGMYRSDSRQSLSGPSTSKSGSRSSTPSSQPGKQPKRQRDQLDEKISSILTSLPGRIHLVAPANHDNDGSSVTSSLPPRRQERFRSESPVGTPSRCGTPAPSLTLTPAVSRRRHSHAPEESSVKLYHLHRGGKAPATKLFVRTVGANGERVMVRVGGGWADLGEYLREYVMHHGRRNISETPRVEVQGISTRDSPGSLLTPNAYTGGRTTPSRPGSVMSNRPASSLAVRKTTTRRASNASDVTDLRSFSAGDTLNVSFSPLSTVSSRRRLSVSSNTSVGESSFTSEAHHGSSGHSPSTTIAAGSARSVPLGLAGPRSRHVSMSPESEAWVEDVLGQARRSTSMRPTKFNIPTDQDPPANNTPTLSKVRSVSDIGAAGMSRRVALRGLGNRV